MYKIIECIGFLLTISPLSLGTECYGKNGFECCNGFRWNAYTGRCEECPRGYYGKRCMLKCKYPSYGVRCQFECSCKAAFCDPADGCYSLKTKETQFVSSHQIFITDQRFTTDTTVEDLQTVTSFDSIHMNSSFQSPIINQKDTLSLPITISSIVLLSIVFSILIFFRNYNGCRMTTKIALEPASVSNRITDTDDPGGTEEDSVVYLRSHELQQNVIIENEQISHLYEEVKEQQYGRLEQNLEHKQYLTITDEIRPCSKDNSLGTEEVYLTPVSMGDRHITGSSVNRAEYITPIA